MERTGCASPAYAVRGSAHEEGEQRARRLPQPDGVRASRAGHRGQRRNGCARSWTGCVDRASVSTWSNGGSPGLRDRGRRLPLLRSSSRTTTRPSPARRSPARRSRLGPRVLSRLHDDGSARPGFTVPRLPATLREPRRPIEHNAPSRRAAPRSSPTSLFLIQHHQLFGVYHRELTQQDLIDEGEDRRIGADSETERENRHDRKERTAQKAAHGEPDVVDWKRHAFVRRSGSRKGWGATRSRARIMTPHDHARARCRG